MNLEIRNIRNSKGNRLKKAGVSLPGVFLVRYSECLTHQIVWCPWILSTVRCVAAPLALIIKYCATQLSNFSPMVNVTDYFYSSTVHGWVCSCNTWVFSIQATLYIYFFTSHRQIFYSQLQSSWIIQKMQHHKVENLLEILGSVTTNKGWSYDVIRWGR